MGTDRGAKIVKGGSLSTGFEAIWGLHWGRPPLTSHFGKKWVIWKNLDFLGKFSLIGKIWKLGPWRPTSDRSKSPGPQKGKERAFAPSLFILLHHPLPQGRRHSHRNPPQDYQECKYHPSNRGKYNPLWDKGV
jgi:hypothetical protein